MPALDALVGFVELHPRALADVAVISAGQVTAEELEGEGVAFHLLARVLQLLILWFDLHRVDPLRTGLVEHGSAGLR